MDKQVIENLPEELAAAAAAVEAGPFRDIQNPRQRAFLAAFCVTGLVSDASKSTGIPLKTHYSWTYLDPEYKRAYDKAVEISGTILESTALKRALKGQVRLKFYQGEPIMIDDPEHPGRKTPYREVEYSESLVIKLLAGLKPERYGDKNVNIGQYNQQNVFVGDVGLSSALAEIGITEDDIGGGVEAGQGRGAERFPSIDGPSADEDGGVEVG